MLTSCGRPGVHMEFKIVDDHGNTLPPGEVGKFG